MRHLVAPAVALVLLVGLPMVVPTPESDAGTWLAVGIALVLIAIAVRGVVRFVRSRKPRSFHDSIMPDKAVPPKVTVMDKPTDK
jgi:hypothetical protein